MRDFKQKGITLIALVITIIILLILAGITIGIATNGTGLFDKAKEATQKYQNAQNDEEMQIAKYSNEIESWTRAGSGYSIEKLWGFDNTAASTDMSSGIKEGTIELSKSIDLFDEIVVTGQIYNNSTEYAQASSLRIIKPNYYVESNYDGWTHELCLESNAHRIVFSFDDNTHLKLEKIDSARLLNVYGIKY